MPSGAGQKGVPDWKIDKIKYFLAPSVRQIDHVDRGLLKGETIPQNEKVFSILEPHTRWISKGKAGRPVELGVPVCIVEDQFSFILHSEIMWQGSDADFAAPMVEITRAVVALNVHRLGRLVRDNAPREKTRKRHRHAA